MLVKTGDLSGPKIICTPEDQYINFRLLLEESTEVRSYLRASFRIWNFVHPGAKAGGPKKLEFYLSLPG